MNYYTRDSFLFKRVNKALRQQNFQAILSFRFFLLDMEAQLQTAYREFSNGYEQGDMMIFYRGQCMLKEEMDVLQEERRTGSLITVNSYLSTSISRDTALSFVPQNLSAKLVPVILEITAQFKDPAIMRRKPFAYVGHLSQFRSNECEVLFSMGSFFRVDDIAFNEQESLYVIKLTFIYDEEHHTITDDYRTLRSCPTEEKLIKTGSLLSNHFKHGHFKANAFFQRFLADSDLINIKAACHAGLGWVALKRKQHSVAENYQKQALQMYAAMEDVDHLYVSSYNCLGAVYWQQGTYSKALSFYLKAYEIGPPTAPIDKYSFYNSFMNVSAVNVACLYKIQGFIELAWSTYKKLLPLQMKDAAHLHAAVYLKIAEAGFAQGTSFNSTDEELDWLQNWQRFLDLSLTDMSSSYRRSIVSGVLSIGWRFANNEQRSDVAIAYYKKVIEISQRFIAHSAVDEGIVLRCYQQIAQLYREKNSLYMSINYATNGLKLCRASDLESIVTFYEMMANVYEEQLRQLNSSLSPLDIDLRIGTANLELDYVVVVHPNNPPPPAPILEFQRDEFAFGQYKKVLNSNLIKEPNPKRCLAHCLLKIAVQQQERGKTDNIHELLHRARCLVPTDTEVAFVCVNNLSYLDGTFAQIIDNYRRSLEERQSTGLHSCIGEDAFCYIAHLYEKTGQIDQARQWYLKACQYFEEHRLFCEHTRPCYNRVASFCERNHDPSSAASIYRRLVHQLLNHRHETSLVQRDTVLLMEQTTKDVGSADQIFILKHLVQIALKPVNAQLIDRIDEEVVAIFKRLREQKKDPWAAAFIYQSYIKVILRHNSSLLTPFVRRTLTICDCAVDVYKAAYNPIEAFEVWQRLAGIVMKYSNDRHQILSFIKQLGLDLESREYIRAALGIYDALYEFIYAHTPAICYQNNDLLIYILDRCQRLAESKKEPAPPIYRRMIGMLQSFKQHVSPDFDMKVYIARLETYYMKLAIAEASSARESYEHVLDLFVGSPTERFDEVLAKIVDQMKDRPTELLKLLAKYRIDYAPLIRLVLQRLEPPNGPPTSVEKFPPSSSIRVDNLLSSYNSRVKRYLNSTNSKQRIAACWTECIRFLLEQCSKQDENLAFCYLQLSDPIQAAQIFDRTIYEEIALKYCPNACRRYLKFVYPIHDTREELESLFATHFQLVNGNQEIRSLEPVQY